MTNCTDGHEWEYRPISWLGCKNCPATLSCDETTSMLNEHAALKRENDNYKGELEHIKRWANSYNVHVDPRVILNAVVRMCDDALLAEQESE